MRLPFQSAADSIVSYSPPYYNEAPGPGPGVFVCPESRPDPKPEALLEASRPDPEPEPILLFVFCLYCGYTV